MEAFGLLMLWDLYDKAYQDLENIHEPFHNETDLGQLPNHQDQILGQVSKITLLGLVLACLSMLEGMTSSTAYGASEAADVASIPLDKSYLIHPTTIVEHQDAQLTELNAPSQSQAADILSVPAESVGVSQLDIAASINSIELSQPASPQLPEVTSPDKIAALPETSVILQPEYILESPNTPSSPVTSVQVDAIPQNNEQAPADLDVTTDTVAPSTVDSTVPGQSSSSTVIDAQQLPKEAIPQLRVLSPDANASDVVTNKATSESNSIITEHESPDDSLPSGISSASSPAISSFETTDLPEEAVPSTTVLLPQSSPDQIQDTVAATVPDHEPSTAAESNKLSNSTDIKPISNVATVENTTPANLTPQPKQLLAQAIVPANDGTGTEVTQSGNQIDIHGGALSGDNANLFHSFQQFGLSNDQIANFLASPDIRNVLSRIAGGDPSTVDGLIRVTGGSPNLFLMNPAGIIFGSNAQLDVPAGFTATTADGIGFDEDVWFSASGENLYESLQGDPTDFAFSAEQPGALINAGDLEVNEAQNLTLLGGTVTNTGTLTASEGQILVAAVPGENKVRISQTGVLLELAIDALSGNGPNPLPYSPATLPALLTGSEIQQVTGIRLNPDGTVELLGSSTSIPVTDGTTIASGELDVSGEVGGEVGILGESIAVTNADINASGDFGGGTVRIGGDYQGGNALPAATNTFIDDDVQISADALIEGDGGLVVGWAENTTGFYGDISARGGSESGDGGFVEVSGKQDLIYRGSVDTFAANGASGTLLLDPENILIVDGDGGLEDGQLDENVPDGDLPGQILSGQGAGTFTISELALEQLSGDTNVLLEATNDITLSDLTDNQLTFAAGEGDIVLTADADNDGAGSFTMADLGDLNVEAEFGDEIFAPGRDITISGASISLGRITTIGRFDPDSGQVFDSGNISLTASSGDISAHTLSTRFSISDINTGTGNGGDITVSTPNGGIQIRSVASDAFINERGNAGNGGSILFEAGENIQLTRVDARSQATNTNGNSGNGGAINLDAGGNITIEDHLFSFSQSANGLTGNGGDINLNARGGSIDILGLDLGGATQTVSSAVRGNTQGAGNGGAITFTAQEDINISSVTQSDFESGSFATSGTSGDGGAISLTAGNEIDLAGGILRTVSVVTNQGTAGNGGEITIDAGGDITAGSLDSSSSVEGTSDTVEASDGGDIVLTSETGNITVTSIDSSSTAESTGDSITATARNAGDIILTANGGIDITDTITATSNSTATDNIGDLILETAIANSGNAGNVTLDTNGAITIGGTINTSSDAAADDQFGRNAEATAGDGGAVLVENASDFTVGDINTSSSASSSIDPDAVEPDIVEVSGSAGSVTITTANDIRVNDGINAEAQDGSGGSVSLTGGNDIIIDQDILTESELNDGGEVRLLAGDNINIDDIFSDSNDGDNGGDISLEAGDSIVADFISSRIDNGGNSGDINLTAGNSIEAANIDSSIIEGSGNGGDISLEAGTDIIIDFDVESDTNQGAGGDISLFAGNLISIGEGGEGGDLITSDSRDGDGGNVELNAGGNILLRDGVDASGTNGFGGQVDLTSGNELTVGDIDATGTIGGSNISLTSNSLNLFDGVNSVRSNGGDLLIQSFTPSQNLQFDESIFSALEDGFNEITIGRIDGGGAITLTGDLNISDPLTVRSPAGSGSIETINSALTTNGDNVSLIAADRVTFGDITTNGGDIEITTTNGDITTGILDSSIAETVEGFTNIVSVAGPGGSINLNSGGNIDTEDLDSSSSAEATGNSVTATAGGGGDITLTAVNNVNIAGDINSSSLVTAIDDDRNPPLITANANGADGGAVTINAGGNIDINDGIRSSSVATARDQSGVANATAGDGGAIALDSGGNINVDSLRSVSLATATGDSVEAAAGTGGEITVTAAGNIDAATRLETTQVIDSSSRAVATDNVSNPILLETAIASTENGGQIILNSGGDINIIGDLNSSSSTRARDQFGGVATATSGDGGAITIENSNSITVDEIDTSSSATAISSGNPENAIETSGAGGAVTLTAENTIDIDEDVQTDAQDGDGGAIVFNAGGAITVGEDIKSSSDRANGGNISLTSGNAIQAFDIDSSVSEGPGNGGNITLNAGTDIIIDDDLTSATNQGTGGSISLFAGGLISSGEGGGDEEGPFFGPITSNSENGAGGNVELNAQGDILVGDGIDASGINGSGGQISITNTTGDISTGILDSSSLATATAESGVANVTAGDGGAITLNSGGDIFTDPLISSSSATATGDSVEASAGNGGAITVIASGNIEIDNRFEITQVINSSSSATATDNTGAFIILETAEATTGNGGQVTLNSGGDISIFGDLNASSSTNATDEFGGVATANSGDGGAITIESDNGLSVNRIDSSSSAISESINAEAENSTAVASDGGNINITITGETSATSINASSSAEVTGNSVTATAGSGGNIATTGTGNINISESLDSSVTADATDNVEENSSEEESSEEGSLLLGTAIATAVNGGNITLNTNNAITIGGTVNTSSSATADDQFGSVAQSTAGNGGAVLVENASDFTVGDINTSSSASSSIDFSAAETPDITEVSGAAGSVTISTTNDIRVNDGINAEAQDGSGGSVRLTSENDIIIDQDIRTESDLDNGGEVRLSAEGNINIDDIVSSSNDGGDGGDIILEADEDIVADFVFSGTENSGNGGDIRLDSGNSIQATDINSSVVEGTGEGGDIDLDAGTDIIIDDDITSAANRGTGGNISLFAGNLISAGEGEGGEGDSFFGPITSNSDDGDGGSVKLDAGGDILVRDGIDASGTNGLGGQVDLTSGDAIIAGDIDATGGTNGGSNISLTSNSLDLVGGVDSVRSNGGSLLIQSFTPSQNLQFDESTFSALADGFSEITIGRSDGSGTIFLTGNLNISDPLTVRSPSGSGSINTANAALTTNGNDVTLTANENITAGTIASNSNASNGEGFINLRSDEIDLAGALSGDSLLILEPFNTEQSIAIGGTDNSTSSLDLTSLELERLQRGFSKIVIGSDNGIGDITIEPFEFKDRAFLQTPGGLIAINGGLQPDITPIANQITTTLREDIDASTALNFFGNILVENDVTIASTGSNSTLNFQGPVQGNRSLTINAASNVNFGSIVGQPNNPLSQLTVNSQTTNLGGNVTATGDVTFNSDIEASQPIEIRSRDGAVNTGNITASGNRVALLALESISAGNIDTSSTTGPGGDVVLDPENDIEIGSINAEGGPNSTGGTVDIFTERFFRATETFITQAGGTASISTAGGAGNGTIRIRHGGGLQGEPFIIGDASQNGTASAITRGTFSLNPRLVLPGSFISNGIEIITPEPPPPPATTNPESQSETEPINEDPPPEIVLNRLNPLDANLSIFEIEQDYTGDFESYLDLDESAAIQDLAASRARLAKLESETGVKPALIYTTFAPAIDENSNDAIRSQSTGDSDLLTNIIPDLPNNPRQEQLILTLVTSKEEVIQVRLPQTTREQVLRLARQMESDITNPVRRQNPEPLLAPSQELYELLVSPLESEFQKLEIDNLVFIMDEGLRSLPLAALHDGESFIIENYSVGLMPSLSLTNTEYVDLRGSNMLAMGTSEFSGSEGNEILSGGNLPAVSLEFSALKRNEWISEAEDNVFRGENFTLSNFQNQSNYDIFHLATHASFRPGEIENSYIQFQDAPLRFNDFRSLELSDEQIELMVLSACRTALGDLEAELGFAGAAAQSQVKTVMASLWSVSDIGASGLVAEFYSQLRQAPIKAEALRQAQLAMLQGDVQIQDGKLQWFGGEIDLNELEGLSQENRDALITAATDIDLSHPYYWSAFTLVGNPW